jgi:diacylglycerol kinase family enzyme
VYRARRVGVHVDEPLAVSLDGEIAGHVPGAVVLAGEALRVVTGPRFVDVDDPEGVVIWTRTTP